MRALLALALLGALAGLFRRALRPLLVVLALLLVAACTHTRALPVALAPDTVTLTNDSAEALTVFLTIPPRSDLVIRTVRKGLR